jgi:hypothetical protein
MELGTDGVRWVRLVPEWRGNKDLPEEEQLSLDIQRLTTAEIYSLDETTLTLKGWIEQQIDKFPGDPLREEMEKAKDFPLSILSMGRQFVDNTRNLKNFIFDKKEEKDPFKVFILSTPSGDAELSLVSFINARITDVSTQFGDELKNSVRLFGGGCPETS